MGHLKLLKASPAASSHGSGTQGSLWSTHVYTCLHSHTSRHLRHLWRTLLIFLVSLGEGFGVSRWLGSKGSFWPFFGGRKLSNVWRFLETSVLLQLSKRCCLLHFCPYCGCPSHRRLVVDGMVSDESFAGAGKSTMHLGLMVCFHDPSEQTSSRLILTIQKCP